MFTTYLQWAAQQSYIDADTLAYLRQVIADRGSEDAWFDLPYAENFRAVHEAEVHPVIINQNATGSEPAIIAYTPSGSPTDAGPAWMDPEDVALLRSVARQINGRWYIPDAAQLYIVRKYNIGEPHDWTDIAVNIFGAMIFLAPIAIAEMAAISAAPAGPEVFVDPWDLIPDATVTYQPLIEPLVEPLPETLMSNSPLNPPSLTDAPPQYPMPEPTPPPPATQIPQYPMPEPTPPPPASPIDAPGGWPGNTLAPPGLPNLPSVPPGTGTLLQRLLNSGSSAPAGTQYPGGQSSLLLPVIINGTAPPQVNSFNDTISELARSPWFWLTIGTGAVLIARS